MTNGPRVEELMLTLAENDIELMFAIQATVDEMREQLDKAETPWDGARAVSELVQLGIAEEFGHDLIHHRRKAPHPDRVRTFAFIMAVVHALVEDGPST